MDDINRYRDLFFEETDEYLQKLNDCLLQLEKNPEDNNLLDDIFRSAHTLKGMAATMGYNTMTELTHSMENVFELFRNGSISINSQSITLIFSSLDKLSEIVEDLRAEKYLDYDIKDLLESLNNVSNIFTSSEVSSTDFMVIQSAREENYNAFNIVVKISEDSLLKGPRAYIVVNKLEKEGEIIHSEPSPQKLEEGDFDNVFKLLYLSKLDEYSVKEIIENVGEIEEVLIEEIDGNQIEEKEGKIKDDEFRKNNKNNVHYGNQSIRVDLNRLDNFMNLVSELVIYRNRLENISNNYNTSEINEPLEQVARITSELQDLVLKIRMEPVNVVLNRFPRMIRDLSKELNKEIELIIEGEETELDRTIVSELGEPLVHLIRNAADHGIESANNRQALGKSKVGLIRLSAYQEGNRVVITVRDDGKGIDPEVIRESAEKKGINTQGMGHKDLIQLIFDQGFSTVDKVTNVSGRGVGMDVVKQKISSLGGSLEVISEVNKGTTFVIKLPLTLSIIQVLMVNIGEESFALPLGIIEKVVNVKKDEIIKSHNDELYLYMGKAIPVVRVNEKLGIKSLGSNKHIIVVSLGGNQYGLLVDGLIGQQEIVIKKLSGVLSHMKEYLGATILGNGDITLILDAGNLCKNTELE